MNHCRIPRIRLADPCELRIRITAEKPQLGVCKLGFRVARALKQVLVKKGVMSADGVRAAVERLESMGQRAEGGRIVARTWLDPHFMVSITNSSLFGSHGASA